MKTHALLIVFGLLFSAPALADCAKEKSHADSVACLTRELEKTRQELQSAENKASQEALKMEKEAKEADSAQYEGLSKTFERSSASFRQYVKDTCDYSAGLLGAGTWAADARIICEKRLAEQRIKMLTLNTGN